MPDRKNSPVPRKENFFQDILLNIRLVIRLMRDQRVSGWLKLLPVASALYWLVPDLAIGPVDDVAVIWVGLTLFVELSPPHVVEEHRRELWQIAEMQKKDVKPPAVIDGEFSEVSRDVIQTREED